MRTGVVATLAPHCAAPSCATEVTALHLAGFLTAAEAARRLGLKLGDLKLLLGDIGLDGLAMVPATIDHELATCYLPIGRDAFAAPTFDDVIDGHFISDAPASHRFRLAADEILGCSQTGQRPAFGAIILHVGRSGSTLLCNLLTNVFGWATLREPEFINSLLLRLAANRHTDEREWLGELVARLLQSLGHGVRVGPDGRKRTSILKLSSWNAVLADEFVWRLGDMPVIVLTRDPLATVASFLHHAPHWYSHHTAKIPAQLVPNASRIEAARFFAEMWNQVIDVALRLPADRTLFVEYDNLNANLHSVLSTISAHVGSGGAHARFESLAGIMEQYSKGVGKEKFDARNRHRRPVLEPELRRLVTTITAQTRSALRVRTSGAAGTKGSLTPRMRSAP